MSWKEIEKTLYFLTGTAAESSALPGAAACRSGKVVFDASTEGTPQTDSLEEAPQAEQA